MFINYINFYSVHCIWKSHQTFDNSQIENGHVYIQEIHTPLFPLISQNMWKNNHQTFDEKLSDHGNTRDIKLQKGSM